MSSPCLIRCLLSACWVVPVSVAALPAAGWARRRWNPGSSSCRLRGVWTAEYSAAVAACLAAAAAFAAAAFVAVNFCRGRRRFRAAGGSGGGPFDGDVQPICRKGSCDGRRCPPAKKKGTGSDGGRGSSSCAQCPRQQTSSSTAKSVVVIHPLHVSSSSAAASAAVSSSFGHAGAALAQLACAAALYAPALLHSCNFGGASRESPSGEDEDGGGGAWVLSLSLAWLSASAAGASVPVAHLLCDDVVSGLGLEALRDLLRWAVGERVLECWWRICDGRGGGGGGGRGGVENEAFLGTPT